MRICCLKCKNASADSTQEILVNPLTKRQVDLEKIKNKKFKKVVDILELFLYNESCVTDKAF